MCKVLHTHGYIYSNSQPIHILSVLRCGGRNKLGINNTCGDGAAVVVVKITDNFFSFTGTHWWLGEAKGGDT